MRLILSAFLLSLSVPAMAATPDCAGSVEISHARIVRIEKNGALILNDGRAAMLEGIRLPLNDDGSSALAEEALKSLRNLATAEPLTLTAVAPKEDRYDRVRVQAFGSVWLQTELLRRGLARVAISPDRVDCAGELYKAEKEARAAGRGLWSLAAFAVRKPDSVTTSDEGKFLVVEGPVANGAVHDGRVFLDHRAGRSRQFPQDQSTTGKPGGSCHPGTGGGAGLPGPCGDRRLQSGPNRACAIICIHHIAGAKAHDLVRCMIDSGLPPFL
jgi:hypothetical protein